MKLSVAIIAMTWAGLWMTQDQQGMHAYKKKDYQQAAAKFENHQWQAASLYQGRDFKAALALYAQYDTAEGHYNAGNCLVMLGKYDAAVSRYDRALEKRPDWKEAKENRSLAQARAEMLKSEGGDMGDQREGADKVVFDKKKEGGEETELDKENATGDKTMQALWLRRVQTKPADFLKQKFSFQQQKGGEQ